MLSRQLVRSCSARCWQPWGGGEGLHRKIASGLKDFKDGSFFHFVLQREQFFFEVDAECDKGGKTRRLRGREAVAHAFEQLGRKKNAILAELDPVIP